MPYVHCCGSVMSPGVDVDMGGCNICTMNTHIFCVTIVGCAYLSVAMVACCCTGTITRTPRQVIRWIAATCKFNRMIAISVFRPCKMGGRRRGRGKKAREVTQSISKAQMLLWHFIKKLFGTLTYYI